jgi:uncharacterized protein
MGWIVDVDFRKSPIHGTGAFARTRIPAGTKVWVFDDSMKVCGLPELAALTPSELEFALHGGYLHHPSGRFVWYDDGMHFVNHADSPYANIGISEWTPLREDNCTAMRDIEPGEELLEDYSFWSIFSLNREHWLRKLYRDFCPSHYAFLSSLEERRRAA